MLQIRRGYRANIRIISHITPYKHIWDPSLERSRRDSSNEGSMKKLSSNYPKYPSLSVALGPVVQSIVSLTSSLRGQLVMCFKTL